MLSWACFPGPTGRYLRKGSMERSRPLVGEAPRAVDSSISRTFPRAAEPYSKRLPFNYKKNELITVTIPPSLIPFTFTCSTQKLIRQLCTHRKIDIGNTYYRKMCKKTWTWNMNRKHDENRVGIVLSWRQISWLCQIYHKNILDSERKILSTVNRFGFVRQSGSSWKACI